MFKIQLLHLISFKIIFHTAVQWPPEGGGDQRRHPHRLAEMQGDDAVAQRAMHIVNGLRLRALRRQVCGVPPVRVCASTVGSSGGGYPPTATSTFLPTLPWLDPTQEFS